MNLELFWSAFGSIGTMLACIIAVLQPIVERYIERKKKVIVSFETDMSEYDMSWTNNTILSAANLIGRVFAGSNLSHEEALSEWLMKYRTQIESATKCIKKATLPGLNSAGTTAAIIVAAMNDVPAIYIEKFMDVFYSGFTNNEAEHYAITLRDELLRENRVKRGTQYARFAFFRTANRLNQYYKTATGQRVAKRVNNGDFPYNVYDANGGIVKPETKKTKKAG